MRLLEQCERLVMVLQRFAGLFDSHMPVTHAVETMSKGDRIVHVACQRKCLLKISTCLGVIAFCPEKAQVTQSLPLRPAVSSLPGHLKGGLIIQACLLKITQCFVGPSAQAIERGRGRNRSMLSGIQRSHQMLDGGM